MAFLSNLPIGRRIAALGAIGIAVAGVIGTAGLISSGRVTDAEASVHTLTQLDLALLHLDVEHSNSQIATRDAQLARTAANTTKAKSEQADAAASIDAVWATVAALDLSAEQRATMDDLHAALDTYMSASAAELDSLRGFVPESAAGQEFATAFEKRVATVDDKVTAAEKAFGDGRKVAEESLAATLAELRMAIILSLVGGIAFVALSGWQITRSITRPIESMVSTLKAVAAKDLTVAVPAVTRDEIGQMAQALGEALGSMRLAMSGLGSATASLSEQSDQLTRTSASMEGSAQTTSRETDEVASAVNQVSAGVGAMSAATEQMSASIREIAQNASTAADVAQHAVRTAADTSNAVGRLDQASTEIGEILRTITAIAEQTNLLALNATIEAARAGSAGKGFAVVANEVKDLAHATARATDDIGRRIVAIQATTQEATTAIAQISTVVTEINDLQTTIAAAVEEQSATTAEISRGVAAVAMSSSQISASVGGVSSAASATSAGAAQTQASAHGLADLAGGLRRLVGDFRY